MKLGPVHWWWRWPPDMEWLEGGGGNPYFDSSAWYALKRGDNAGTAWLPTTEGFFGQAVLRKSKK